MPRRLWSAEEDAKLIALVEQYGDKPGRESKWTEISKNLPGRTNKVSFLRARLQTEY